MDKLSWVKELVQEELRMEESGIVDVQMGFDPERHLTTESLEFLQDLKASFVEVATAFNQMKSTQLGRVKIYGISNTHSDFMLFRNGFKLIFSLKEPGIISMKFQYAGTSFVGSAGPEWAGSSPEDLLHARWGPFGDLIWTYQDQPIKLDYLVRYYMSRFVRESAK
jgi:hypothetical protein